MKKIKLIFTVLFFVFVIKDSSSLDTLTTKYFPLKIGNIWKYYFYDYNEGVTSTGYLRIRINDTTHVNGNTYFTYVTAIYQIQGTNQAIPDNFGFGEAIRVDLMSGNIYKTSSCFYTSILDSLYSHLNDISNSCIFNSPSICTDTNNFNIFGNTYPAKKYEHRPLPPYYHHQLYAKEIGIIHSGTLWHYGDSYDTLVGAYVSGVLYGDTSFPVGIIKISSEVPTTFLLYQNYPNPFNPSTKIKFEIPKESFTKLIIYDILGREVSTLLNEKLKPSTYEVELEASNFTSGVYFYKLTAGDFVETKKMVILK